MNRIKFLGVLVGAILLSGCFEQVSDTSPKVATFKDGAITAQQFKNRISGLPKEVKAAALQRKADFVNEMIDEFYLEKEAKKRRIEEDADVKALFAEARRKIIIAKLVETEIDKKISIQPDDAQNFYDSNKEKFMTQLTVRASHILVKTEDEARGVLAKLQAGADFEQLAREKSIHRSAAAGGDIGFFSKGQLIKEFEETAFELKKGELSGVVKSQFGYHVIKLTDRIEPSLKSFESVKGLIERQLLNEKKAKLFKGFTASLRQNVKVDLDEKALENVS